MSNQTNFRGGPAYLTWDSTTWKMREDWKVVLPDQMFDIPSASGVGISKGIADKVGKITFVPKIFKTGLAAQIAALFPYTNPSSAGALVRPTSDLPAVIHKKFGGTSDLGLTGTAYAAMLTKMPPVTFAPDKPLVGSAVELSYLQALGTNVGDAASLFAAASASYSEPAWTIADELFDRYTLALGYLGTITAATTNTSTNVTVTSTAGILPGQAITGTGIPASTTVASITSSTVFVLSAAATATNASVTLTLAQLTVVTDKDGITFTPNCVLDPVKPAMEPTRDYRQGMLTGTLSFRPHNIDVDTFYSTYFPETADVLGGSVEQAQTCQANITGAKSGGLNLVIPLVRKAKAGHEFSTKNPVTDKVELEAIQAYQSSAWQPLFTFGVNS